MKKRKTVLHSFLKQLRRGLFDPASGTDRFSMGGRSAPPGPKPREADRSEDAGAAPGPSRLSGDPQRDVRALEALFHAPRNGDFKTSVLRLNAGAGAGAGQSFSVVVMYLQGAADETKIDDTVVRPLKAAAAAKEKLTPSTLHLYAAQTSPLSHAETYEQVAGALLDGSAALIAPGERRALLVPAARVEHRSVGDAKTELVIRGPHEGFVESIETNVALLRKTIRSEHLVAEYVELEPMYRTKAAILYLGNVANEKLVDEVRRRVTGIDMEYPANALVLQQLIEDKPNSLLPTLTATERPDRAAGSLIDGGVIVLAGGTPFALLCPTTFWTLFHTSEEIYSRLAYANFVRLVRLFAAFFALFAPGVYISLVNFQPEMLPTDLMFHIAGNRELLPFPTLVEILLMEVAFELIREAGIRIPSVIGSTIGIVGALILGQAAVQANLVSPLLVILVSITGLGSFAVPNQDLSYAIRLGRFVFLLLGAMLGFFGISLGVVFMLGHMASLQSFGVPFLAPLYPDMEANRDYIFRSSLWKQTAYGQFTRPRKKRRALGAVRIWKNVWEERSP